MKTALIVSALSLSASLAFAQDASSSGMKYGAQSGSVYSSYGSAAFVRGSYGFAGRGGSPFDEAFGGSVGYRWPLSRNGSNAFSVETELLYARNSEDSILLTVPVEATVWALTGLVSLRWDMAPEGKVNPFVSVGVGPSYMRAKIETPTTSVSDDDVTVAYSGRAGVVIDLNERVSFEPAYRYLGTTQSGAPGVHAAEIGFNIGF